MNTFCKSLSLLQQEPHAAEEELAVCLSLIEVISSRQDIMETLQEQDIALITRVLELNALLEKDLTYARLLMPRLTPSASALTFLKLIRFTSQRLRALIVQKPYSIPQQKELYTGTTIQTLIQAQEFGGKEPGESG